MVSIISMYTRLQGVIMQEHRSGSNPHNRTGKYKIPLNQDLSEVHKKIANVDLRLV
ncbi:MAG: hypothetical protein Q8S18_04125 [Bacteroidales bacterium]|nr:hypothetical protein [Bacteroidales bacterium]